MAITPGHFLVGEQIVRPLGPRLLEVPTNRLDAWERMHQLEQQFCDRWQAEYLTEMQRRTKWCRPNQNLQVGDLVFLKQDNMPPGQWMRGRIVATYPGKDGLVRSVRVKTAKGSYDRPVNKCCYLPIEGAAIEQATTSRRGRAGPSDGEDATRADDALCAPSGQHVRETAI